VAGATLPLSWDVFYYTVLIADFHADYATGTWIPYRIVCTVLQDEAAALLQAAVSLATMALADIGVAATYAVDCGIDLSASQSALAAPGATTRGTAAYTSAQIGLSQASSTIDARIVTANATLAEANIENAGSAAAGVAAVRTATDASGQLTSLYSTQAYVRRTATNLANAST
jgi:hypothetical protein